MKLNNDDIKTSMYPTQSTYEVLQSTLTETDDDLFITGDENDERLAEKLQLQEVFKLSTQLSYLATTDVERAKQTGSYNSDTLHNLENYVLDELEDFDSPFLGSVTEFGQSSDYNSDKEEVFACTICMESKPVKEGFNIKGCQHKFCASCISKYVEEKVNQNILVVSCPIPGCKDGRLEVEMCRSVLPEDVYGRWGLALCESSLGTNKLYCPYRDCSMMVSLDSLDDQQGEAVTDAECPHCFKWLCAQCKVPWHNGFSCQEFQLLGEDERGQEELMLRKLAMDNKWQKCPKCKMYVDRIEGCRYIHCRCGYCFCYECGAKMLKDNHYCKNCQR